MLPREPPDPTPPPPPPLATRVVDATASAGHARPLAPPRSASIGTDVSNMSARGVAKVKDGVKEFKGRAAGLLGMALGPLGRRGKHADASKSAHCPLEASPRKPYFPWHLFYEAWCVHSHPQVERVRRRQIRTERRAARSTLRSASMSRSCSPRFATAGCVGTWRRARPITRPTSPYPHAC